ncbi:hypothetical protein KC902_04260 [Candidatus Kaiserbacteria bacterium]|nr:hypothetical protein [Candidatus Kaiserbacteria bacterium]USN88695.1 MAG: hypothetical protein H6780_04385 [Candidatus Nomurabacteria bacterium]
MNNLLIPFNNPTSHSTYLTAEVVTHCTDTYTEFDFTTRAIIDKHPIDILNDFYADTTNIIERSLIESKNKYPELVA